MRITSRRLIPAIALILSGGLALTVAQVAAAAPAPPSAAVRAVPVRGQKIVTLPTGDQVRLVPRANAPASTLVQPAARSGPAATLVTRRAGTDTYVFPAIAEPYLGRFLDPNLFNVTKLGAAARPDKRLPLRLSYSGATPSVPGVTITSASSGAASGYITPSSAASFRTALLKQWTSDAAAGWPARTSLFGATRISADIATPPVVTPSFPMVTLTLKAIGADGAPLDFAFGLVGNVDDARKYTGFVVIVDGEARVSVPKGNYAAVFDDFTFDDTTGTATIYVVPTLQYAVTGAGQTLTTDFRKATATPSVTTPKKATPDSQTFDWTRLDSSGDGGIGSGYFLSGSDQLKLQPTAKATIGSQATTFGWALSGPGTPPSFSYDLAAQTDRIAAKPAYAFTTGDLATTKDRFFTDGPKRNGDFIRFALFPNSGGGGFFVPWVMPATRTGYVGSIGATPDWAAEMDANVDNYDDPGWTFNAQGPIPKGTTVTEDWMRGPIAATIPLQTSYAYCYACRTSTSLSIGLAGVTDSTPGHYGAVFGALDGLPVARFRLYQDSSLIFDEDDYLGIDSIDVPARTATYQAVMDLDRRLTASTQSTQSHTELTFSSAGGQGPATPADWYCSAGDGTGCRVLPIVQARLGMPTTMNGRLPAGTSTVTVTAGRIQGAAASAVKSATLEIRPPGYDWQTVALTAAGGGKYTGKINNADFAGQPVDVRIGAADAGGSTFSETILKAYTVGGAA